MKKNVELLYEDRTQLLKLEITNREGFYLKQHDNIIFLPQEYIEDVIQSIKDFIKQNEL